MNNPFDYFFKHLVEQLKLLNNIVDVSMTPHHYPVVADVKQFPIFRTAKRMVEYFDDLMDEKKEQYHDIIYQLQQIEEQDPASETRRLYEESRERFYRELHTTFIETSNRAHAILQLAEAQGVNKAIIAKLRAIAAFTPEMLVAEYWSED